MMILRIERMSCGYCQKEPKFMKLEEIFKQTSAFDFQTNPVVTHTKSIVLLKNSNDCDELKTVDSCDERFRCSSIVK